MSTPKDSALLEYNYTDDLAIVAYCDTVDRLPTLINYLITNSIALVSALPASVGLYCVLEAGIYKVYTVYVDVESGAYINVYQYSLNWITLANW